MKLYYYLFVIGLFFIPFNNFEGLSFLGEFRNEAGAYFFIAGIISLVYSKKLYVPYNNVIFKVLMVFLVWCFICTLFNVDTIITNYFKHTGGVSRFLRQYVSLLISCIGFFLLFYNAILNLSSNEILERLRKIFLISFIFVSIYGCIETAIVIFHMSFLRPFLDVFEIFPFINVRLHDQRIASVTYEPPFLAIYLITVAGWMFSYILTHKHIIRFLPTVMVLLLTFFSGSRTALIIILFQFTFLIAVLYKTSQYRKHITRFFQIFISAFCLLLLANASNVIKAIEERAESLNFRKNLTKSISNKSRFGMQYAALEVFAEHPVIGVGFGQQAYHTRFHYPTWATKDNYEYKYYYKNQKEPSFPPAYNLYTRLLAETGLIGTSIFVFWIYVCYNAAKKLKRYYKTGPESTLILIIIISLAGFFVNWMQIDSFRMYGLWLCLAILMKINYTSGQDDYKQNSVINTSL